MALRELITQEPMLLIEKQIITKKSSIFKILPVVPDPVSSDLYAMAYKLQKLSN